MEKTNNISPSIQPLDTEVLKAATGNLYETLVVVSKRADQINMKTKEELSRKIREYSSYTDNLEEIHDNKELTEISKMYERMPNADLRALGELNEDKIFYKKGDEEEALI